MYIPSLSQVDSNHPLFLLHSGSEGDFLAYSLDLIFSICQREEPSVASVQSTLVSFVDSSFLESN